MTKIETQTPGSKTAPFPPWETEPFRYGDYRMAVILIC